MAIAPTCDTCDKELLEFGAILLSPPDVQNKVIKFHLCKSCYESLAGDLKVSDPQTFKDSL